jgi:hypothetical protein
MSKAMTKKDEFATAMQELSAEAEKTMPAEGDFFANPGDAFENQMPSPELNARLQNLEKTLADRLDKLANDIAARPVDFTQQFQKIEDQLVAIRGSESVNQQLFDSLHTELRSYRDNFLHESLQKPFINDLVLLYDDLNSLHQQLRAASEEKGGKRGRVAQWRDNLENAIQSLLEILHRLRAGEFSGRGWMYRDAGKAGLCLAGQAGAARGSHRQTLRLMYRFMVDLTRYAPAFFCSRITHRDFPLIGHENCTQDGEITRSLLKGFSSKYGQTQSSRN